MLVGHVEWVYTSPIVTDVIFRYTPICLFRMFEAYGSIQLKKTRIVLVGAGVIGKRHLLASQALDNVELVGIADSTPAAMVTAREFNVPLFDSAGQLLRETETDGVIVATPTEHHLKPTLQSLDAGAHVLVEKPIMATLDECKQTIQRTQSTGRHVLVGHQRRYYDRVNQARDIVQSGGLGKLVSVSGQWTVRKPPDYYHQDWRRKWQAGPILTNLIHELDLLRYIVGDVASISAETSNDVLRFEKEDSAAIALRFCNGALGTFLLSDQSHTPWTWEQGFGENTAFPPTGQNSVRFMGTEGSLEFPNLVVWKSASGESCWTNEIHPTSLEMTQEDAYINQLDHFCHVIQGKVLPRVSAQDATNTLRATLAVYDSAKAGQRVNL